MSFIYEPDHEQQTEDFYIVFGDFDLVLGRNYVLHLDEQNEDAKFPCLSIGHRLHGKFERGQKPEQDVELDPLKFHLAFKSTQDIDDLIETLSGLKERHIEEFGE